MSEQITMLDSPIIPARTAIETFRDSGYKNTASALAELIDNSIEAGAKDIQVLTFEQQVQLKRRTVYQIQRVGIYDDGHGMSAEELAICLQFGNGTRMNSRKGMGRFGIGLPNASVSQARRVEVYSWKNGECYYTYLDVDEVRDTGQQDVNSVTRAEIPQELKSNIYGNSIQDSGTYIVWSKCDRLDMARSKTLYKILSHDLCKIYRHFLDADDAYGDQVEIRLVATGQEREVFQLFANDPLYLMTPNNVPDKNDVATNVFHGNVVMLPIEYDSDGNKSMVEVRFSVALPETQALGGNSIVGRHYGNNTGISFIRAAREIDFGTFGFFNERDARERWWGCEVRFEPILDELFGVTNNKQSVRGIGYVDIEELKRDHPDDWSDFLTYDLKMKLRVELSRIFSQNHRQMMAVIIQRGAGKKGGTPRERAQTDKSTKIANKELEGQKIPTRSSIEGQEKSNDEKTMEWKERLLKGDTTLQDVDATEIAPVKVGLIIEKDFGSWPGSQFLTIEVTGSTCVMVINRKHPFFTDLYERLLESGDDKDVEALDLLLMAYARMEDELYSRIDDLDEMRDVWGKHVKAFLNELRASA